MAEETEKDLTMTPPISDEKNKDDDLTISSSENGDDDGLSLDPHETKIFDEVLTTGVNKARITNDEVDKRVEEKKLDFAIDPLKQAKAFCARAKAHLAGNLLLRNELLTMAAFRKFLDDNEKKKRAAEEAATKDDATPPKKKAKITTTIFPVPAPFSADKEDKVKLSNDEKKYNKKVSKDVFEDDDDDPDDGVIADDIITDLIHVKSNQPLAKTENVSMRVPAENALHIERNAEVISLPCIITKKGRWANCWL